MISKIDALKEVFGFFLQSFTLLRKNLKLCVVLIVVFGGLFPILLLSIQAFALPFISILFSCYFFKNAKHLPITAKINNVWPLLKIRFVSFFYILWKALLWVLLFYILWKALLWGIIWGLKVRISPNEYDPYILVMVPAACASVIAIFVFLFYRLRFAVVDYFVLFYNASFKTSTTSSKSIMNGYKFAVFCLYIFLVLCIMLSMFPLYFLDLFDISDIASAIISLFFISIMIVFGILLFNTTLYLLWNSKKDSIVMDQNKANEILES